MSVAKELEAGFDISYFDLLTGKYDGLLTQELESIYRITSPPIPKELEGLYDLFLQKLIESNFDISYFNVIISKYDVKENISKELEAIFGYTIPKEIEAIYDLLLDIELEGLYDIRTGVVKDLLLQYNIQKATGVILDTKSKFWG